MAKFKLEDGTEIEAFTKEELDAEVAGLKRKNEELLGETKTERERRLELERLQSEAEEARQKEKGEFRELYEKTQAELEKEREQGRTFRQTIQQKELDSAAMRIAGQLTKDMKRAELLKKEAMQFARFIDDGVVFEVGGVQIDQAKLIEKLSADYPFLVDGSGATGGGASGGSSGGATKRLNDLTESERVALAKEDPAKLRQLVEAAKRR